jgi:acetyl esterase/lipase
VLSILLPVLALVAALASLLTWRHAPPFADLWKVAIAVGEFGGWLALFPLGVAALALLALDGPVRWLTVALGVLALVQLAWPTFAAARLARGLPEGLERAFGARAEGEPFALRRKFWRALPPRAAVATEVFSTAGGEELKLDFYRARSAGTAPCLVVVHGGGWDGGDRTQLAEWNHRWAARGYAVAAISYRLAPRFTWPAPGEDTRAALEFIKAHAPRLGVDATRLVLVGRSAGGQIAGAVAYGAGDPAIVGFVSFYAPQDMQFAWSVSREDDALNSVKLMRQYFGGPPDTPERRARYDSGSAQLLVGPRTPPTLLIHGRPDTLVWYRHSERLVARLREAGVAHYHLELPWATHGFDFNPDGPGGQLADYAIESFLRGVTRGARR